MNFDGYRAEAKQALADLQHAENSLTDPASPWNERAKLDQLRAARQKYDQAVAGIRDRAERELTRERERLETRRVEVTRAAAKRDRELLGDQVAFLVLLHKLQHMKPDQLIEALEAARDPWERSVIANIGADLIGEAVTDDPATWRLKARWDTVARQVADPEIMKLQDEDAHLHHVEEGLARLDPLQWAQNTAGRLGVRAEYLVNEA